MITDPFCGLEFDIERRNCYSLLRDFYFANFGIELADYACPADWWENGLDIFRMIAHQEGFSPIDEPAFRWREGDVVLMALGSRVGNHVGVIVGGGKMLHHLRGTRSCVTQYGASFRNNTVGVYRHPSVQLVSQKPLVELIDVLPKHLSKRLADKIAMQATP